MCDDDGALIDSGTFDSALDHGWGIRVEGSCPDARLVAAGEGDDCSLDGVGRVVDGVSGKGDGRCLIRLEHLIMPVLG